VTNSVNITVRDHASGMTPENLSLQSFGQLQMCLPRQQKLAEEDFYVTLFWTIFLRFCGF